jgi:hypothetical protein
MADRARPLCAACGGTIAPGKGWIRDAEGQPVHVRCSSAGPCAICSKPIRPKMGVEAGGRWVHVRCWARELEPQAMLQRDRAGQGIARSRGLIERTRAVIAGAKARTSQCSVCGHSLKGGAGLLFQGDDLVHAACWRTPGPDSAAAAPPPG